MRQPVLPLFFSQENYTLLHAKRSKDILGWNKDILGWNKDILGWNKDILGWNKDILGCKKNFVNFL